MLVFIFTFSACDWLLPEDIYDNHQQELIDLAYSIDYWYPEGFYHDTSEDNVYYENSVSVKSFGNDNSQWIELHTDKINQAREWSDLSNENGSVNRISVEEKETEKFFEFIRINTENENDILISRIHKTSYFKPMLDKFKNLGTIGFYYGDLSVEKVKEFVEYLFVNYSAGIYHSKVLHSHIKETDNNFQHIIRSLKVVYGDWGIYDQIIVEDHHFSLDKAEKVLSVESSEVERIQGNYNSY